MSTDYSRTATNRYLDVMTVRPSTGSFSKSQNHSSLLVSPVLIPHLNHIAVEETHDVQDSCLFYANGHRNPTLQKQIVNTVRSINNIPKVVEKKTTRVRHKKQKEPDPVPLPRAIMFHTKEGKQDYGIKGLLTSLRNSEIKLMSTVTSKVGK